MPIICVNRLIRSELWFGSKKGQCSVFSVQCSVNAKTSEYLLNTEH